MKRWQLELMGVLLLADSLTFFHFPGFHFGGIEGFLLAPILWLVGRQTIARTVSERKPLKAAVRFVIAIFAAFGYLIVITQDMVAILGPLFEVGRVSFFTVSCLLMYWLEDAYALVPLEGVARTILRAVVSLTLASFAAIGFGLAFVLLYLWAHPSMGDTIDFGWMGWAFLSLDLTVPLYATWKLFSAERSMLGYQHVS